MKFLRRPSRLRPVVGGLALAVLLPTPVAAAETGATATGATTIEVASAANSAVCADAPGVTFTDGAQIAAPFRDTVACTAAYGITVGFTDGTFRPGRDVTRQQMALFVARLLTQAEGGTLQIPSAPTSSYPDRAGASPEARRAIDYLTQRKVVQGLADGSYGPDVVVTRQQMASFIARAMREAGATLSAGATNFDDLDPDSAHATNVRALAEAGIVRGYAGGGFRPTQPVTRQQLSQFVVGGATYKFEQDVWHGEFTTAGVPEPVPTPTPGPTPGPQPTPPSTGTPACTRVIPRSQEEVTSAAPGDVLCLEAGTRGALELTGLQGSASRPITIVNHGGVVHIRAAGDYAGIEIENSSHLRITGTGVAAQCGAGVAENQQRCGIRITDSFNGLTGKVRTEHLVVDHLEVGNVESSGLGVHDKTQGRSYVQRDVAFRDLFVHDIGTEGHYHGSSDYREGTAPLLNGVEISRNLVVRTGRDGIQVGSAPWNCRIADNVVRDTGRNAESSHMFGIIVNRGASCDVTGNRVERSPRSGIYDQGLHGQVIARNTVVDSGEVGINVREGDQSRTNPQTPDFPRSSQVLDNRIERTGDDGISLGNAAGTANRVTGNRLSGVSGEPINLRSGVRATVSGNTVQ